MRKLALRLAPITTVAALIATGMVLPSPSAPPAIQSELIQVADAGASRGGTLQDIRPSITPNLVAFDWKGNERATIRFKVLKDGAWSEWHEAEGSPGEGPDHDSREYKHGRTFTADPLWLGDGVEALRVEAAEGKVSDLKLHAIRSPSMRNGPAISSASAHPSWPNVAFRSQWGADESWRSCTPNIADTVRYSIVHHTATANDYSPDDVPAIIRGIYHFHVFTRGFCDIGYNFLVDRFGRVFEGRFGGADRAVIGAHASGFNTRSTGISVIGNFVESALPAAGQAGLRSILAWKLALHEASPNQQIQVVAGAGSKFPEGQTVTIWSISGHKDVDATACPGSIYDLLPMLRHEVQQDMAASIVFFGRQWEPLGAPPGGMQSGPDVASWSTGRLDVFTKGADQGLWHVWWDGFGWSGWERLGGFMASDPAAVSWGPGRIDVFIRGTDNQLWHRFYDGSWSAWESLGGTLTSGPDVASWGSNRLDVFAKGTDGQMWHRWWDGDSWEGWEPLGGFLNSDPGAVSWGSNRIDIFVRGSDDGAWHRWWDGGGWQGWEPLEGVLTSAPDVAAWAPGRLDVFARGSDGQGFIRWFNGGWNHWDALGGNLTSGPGAVSWSQNRIDVFVRGDQNLLWHKWRE